MIPYWIIFAITVTGLIAVNARQAVHDERWAAPSIGLASLVVLALSVFAGLRSPTSDGDYANYLDWMNTLASTRTWVGVVDKDPLFALMGSVLRTYSGSLVYLMLISALLSLAVKLRILHSSEYRELAGFALLFLFARFFIAHEFTQVRGAVGIAFGSLALLYSVQGSRVKAALAFGIAVGIHLSAAGLAPLFLVSDRMDLRTKLLLIGGGAAVVAVFGFAVSPAVLTDLALRAAPYLFGYYETSENTLLSFYFIVKVIVLAVVLLNWRRLGAGMHLASLACLYGLTMTLAFIDIDVFSLRISELVAVFDCICIAYVFRLMYLRAPIAAVGTAVTLAAAFYLSTLAIVYDYEVIHM